MANCSFHLRTLAKYGFVEPAERRGRERPWRTTAGRRSFTPATGSTASMMAVAELGAIAVQREAERVVAFLRSSSVRGPRAGDVTRTVTVNKDSFWATPDEAAEFIQELIGIADRFAGRSDDPAARPPGARLMRLFATVNPDPDTEPAGDGATRPGATIPPAGPVGQDDATEA